MRSALLAFSRIGFGRNLIRPISNNFSLLFATQPAFKSQELFGRFNSSLSQLSPKQKKEKSKMDLKELNHYITPLDIPVVALECSTAFNGLTENEKLYAHYLSKASNIGGTIVLVQTSPESPIIFSLLLDLFKSNTVEGLKKFAIGVCNFSEEEFQALVVYTSAVFSNSGNYKSFGDVKIIPGVSLDKLDLLFQQAQFKGINPKDALNQWTAIREKVYSLSDREKQLGLGEKGITTYFSLNCTMKDAELVGRFLKSQKMEAWNTRVFKSIEGAQTFYEIRFASGDEGQKKEFDFEGNKISFTYGDYKPIMKKVCENLGEAIKYAANSEQEEMLKCYIKSFSKGSYEEHKNGSRFWIKDKGPAVESYIGFIETYRDPAGMRGEFEGFVSFVNREMSAKFSVLVDGAMEFITRLPWGKNFERETFMKPDFTSLDVLTFSGSGVPAGINIPNYDEIRQNEGFKNVSLGNVITSSYKDTKIAFLNDTDKDLMNKYRVPSFEVQVGLHELLGHGSGKLLQLKADGTLNFDGNMINPITNEKIASMYEEGETYDSVFTTLGSPYEECKAECVGLFLSIDNDVLKIFGHEGNEAQEVKYVNWLSMLYAGAAKALEMYQPKAGSWMQAHSQARFVIVQVLIEAGQGLVNIEERVDENGKPDLLMTMDASKIDTVGKKAIGDFLLKLQVYKSTANVSEARKMFDAYSAVNNEGVYPWAKWRDIIIDKKQPRKMLVQHNTVLEGGKVKLLNYEASPQGLIESFMDRFPDSTVYNDLAECWTKDRKYFE